MERIGIFVGFQAAQEILLRSQVVALAAHAKKNIEVEFKEGKASSNMYLPHNGIRAELLSDSHSGYSENVIDDVDDAVQGTDVGLDDGGIDAATFDR